MAQEFTTNAQGVAGADSTDNNFLRDVAGNKADAAATTVGTTKSLMAYLKGALSLFGTPAGASISADLAEIEGETDSIIATLGTPAGASVSADIAEANADLDEIITTLAGLSTNIAVPTADSTANALIQDVVGNKADAAVTAVGTTKSAIAYLKGIINLLSGSGVTITASGFPQIFEKAITSAANAGAVTVATVGSQRILLKSLVVRANSGITSAMTYFTVTAGTAGAVTIINNNDGQHANFVSTDNQFGAAGVWTLPVGGTIVINLTGTAATATDFLITMEYEAIVSGGTLS
jgi:hypothetical protein